MSKSLDKSTSTWKIVVILIGAVLVGAFLTQQGYITLPTGQVAPPPTDGTPIPPPGTTYDSAAIRFALQNLVTGASITAGNEIADICLVVDDTWDPLHKVESLADWATATATSALDYAYGDKVVLHIGSDSDPTGCTDTYDMWYYVTLVPGENVRVLTSDILTAVQTSPSYKYQISGTGTPTGYNVQYTAGLAPVWSLGVLNAIGRSTAATLDLFVAYGGTTLSSVIDGATFSTTPTANATFTSRNEYLTASIIAEAVNTAYAAPMYTVGSTGIFQKRVAVLAFTTNMTQIGSGALAAEGWKPVGLSTLFAEKAFYYVIPELIPTTGQKISKPIPIPVDSNGAAASTNYKFKFWMVDFQLESDVASGSLPITIPTAYGMIQAANGYGIDAKIFAKTWTITAGAAINDVLNVFAATSA